MAKKRNPLTTPVVEPTPAPVAEPATPVAPARRAFRGAGFNDFRAKHDPRWSEKAQKFVHDNEDTLAEQLAYETEKYGSVWNTPLVKEHLGHLLPVLQAKYAGLNPGMVRMNLGNRLRAAVRKANKQS